MSFPLQRRKILKYSKFDLWHTRRYYFRDTVTYKNNLYNERAYKKEKKWIPKLAFEIKNEHFKLNSLKLTEVQRSKKNRDFFSLFQIWFLKFFQILSNFKNYSQYILNEMKE